MPFSPIPEVLEALREGRLVVLCDDEARENEGDLVVAAEKVTPPSSPFMAVNGAASSAPPMTAVRADQLGPCR